MTSLLDVVIVNWNSGAYLGRCVESVMTNCDAENIRAQVVVVDNASTDDSMVGVPSRDPSMTVIRNDRNRGFAAACNQGAAAGSAPYILFVNPDVRLLEGSVIRALQFMQDVARSGRYGICGVQLINASGAVQQSCARFPAWWHLVARALGLNRVLPNRVPNHFLDVGEHLASHEVDQVSGAFFMVRRPVFAMLAGFDERFFVYFEELDFALRARQGGWRCWFLADARAMHGGGGSSNQVLDRRLCYSLISRLQYSNKHFGRLEAVAVVIATMLLEPWSRLAWAGMRGSGRELMATVVGTGMVWCRLPVVLTTGRVDQWRPRN